jgi:hypothetical protein
MSLIGKALKKAGELADQASDAVTNNPTVAKVTKVVGDAAEETIKRGQDIVEAARGKKEGDDKP